MTDLTNQRIMPAYEANTSRPWLGAFQGLMLTC